MKKNKLLDKESIEKAITRLSHEIVEGSSNMDNVAIIGIRTRGEIIASRIKKNISKKKNLSLKYGTLDVTFHRDDFLTNLGSPKIGPSDITFDLNGLDIILIDDVVYTGRTIRAAMNELFSYGRPSSIKLCVLVDRGHRELPIKANYIGKNLPTSHNEHIYVHVEEIDGVDEIFMRKFK
tara:strand:- start:1371 stop:1907 length:537 start_codon:yes stop_codon:yes gene_type:complete